MNLYFQDTLKRSSKLLPPRKTNSLRRREQKKTQLSEHPLTPLQFPGVFSAITRKADLERKSVDFSNAGWILVGFKGALFRRMFDNTVMLYFAHFSPTVASQIESGD